MTRRTGLALAALVAAITPAAPGARAAGCAGVYRNGRWSRIVLPASAPASEAVAVAGPGGRDVVYAFTVQQALEGREVLRSGDGGCTWTTVVSLDTAGAATDPTRLDPAYRIIAMAAAPASPGKPHTVYALAGEDGWGLGASEPVATLVSTDSGGHWTIRQPAATDLAADYPRCYHDGLRTTQLLAVNPSTVYLKCHIGALGDVPTYPLACSDAYYVTHDSGRTWMPIRGRATDPTKATTTDARGCNRDYRDPRPSRSVAGEVWDWGVHQGGVYAGTVKRSRDGGATFTPYVTGRSFASCNPCGYGVLEQGRYAAHPVALFWDQNGLASSSAAGLVPAGKPVPARGKIGTLRNGVLVADAAGGPLVYTAWDVSEPTSSGAFVFDVARRRWRQLPSPPPHPDLSQAWDVFSQVNMFEASGSTTVYAGGYDNFLFRYAP